MAGIHRRAREAAADRRPPLIQPLTHLARIRERPVHVEEHDARRVPPREALRCRGRGTRGRRGRSVRHCRSVGASSERASGRRKTPPPLSPRPHREWRTRQVGPARPLGSASTWPPRTAGARCVVREADSHGRRNDGTATSDTTSSPTRAGEAQEVGRGTGARPGGLHDHVQRESAAHGYAGDYVRAQRGAIAPGLRANPLATLCVAAFPTRDALDGPPQMLDKSAEETEKHGAKGGAGVPAKPRSIEDELREELDELKSSRRFVPCDTVRPGFATHTRSRETKVGMTLTGTKPRGLFLSLLLPPSFLHPVVDPPRSPPSRASRAWC